MIEGDKGEGCHFIAAGFGASNAMGANNVQSKTTMGFRLCVCGIAQRSVVYRIARSSNSPESCESVSMRRRGRGLAGQEEELQ